MEVSQEQLIDMGLNIIGFLAAGGLLVIVSSAFRGRGKGRAAIVAQPTVATDTPTESVPATNTDDSDMEYVSLVPTGSIEKVESPTEAMVGNGSGIKRRNRSEIISMAKEMLQARRSTQEITDSLPVSEAELALLSQSNNGSHGEDNG